MDPCFLSSGARRVLKNIESRIRLCVRPSNDEAIRLYERFGYRRVGEWTKYYQDGESVLVMEKTRVNV